jgi:hypothetical protein
MKAKSLRGGLWLLALPGTAKTKTEIALASPGDRGLIYRIRHEVYARELGQHRVNGAGRLTDALDPNSSILLRASAANSPGSSASRPGCRHSIDKYVRRDRLRSFMDEGFTKCAC